MTDVIPSVRDFLRANVDRMGKRPGNLTRTSFEQDPRQVSSREYLTYAESEFAAQSTQSTINCVGHLKRAVDSQIENFLAHYGLLDFARRNNLSIRSKLEFLEKAGLLPGRALRRFNAVRNRIEHEFERPNLPDLEVLLDLGVAVVSVLELTALLVPARADTKYKIYEGTIGASPEIGTFVLRYSQSPPLFVAGWDLSDDSREFRIGPRQQDEFAYLISCLCSAAPALLRSRR